MSTKSVAQNKRAQGAPSKYAHGQRAYPSRADRVRGYRNLDGGAEKVETLTVDTYSDGDNLVVNVTYDGETETVTYAMTTADANAAGAASSFAAKINLQPNIRRILKAVADGDDVVLTGRFTGLDFTVTTSASGSGAISNATTTAAASPGSVAYGIAIMRDGYASTGEVQGKPIEDDGLTKQSVVLTHGESASAQVAVKFDGVVYFAAGANAAALNTALDAALPTGIGSTVSSTEVTIQPDTAGDTFEIVTLIGDVTINTYTVGDDMDDLLAGLSCYTELSSDGAGYGAGRKVDVCEWGDIALDIAGGALDDKLFVSTTGTDKGTIYRARAANRVAIDRLKVQEVYGSQIIVSVNAA